MLHDGDMVEGMLEIHASDQICENLQVCDKYGKDKDGALYNTKFNNVYVKNLDESTTYEDLKNIFAEHEAITSAVVMRDADGKSKRFGFVKFENVEDATEGIETLNYKKVDGEGWYVGKAQKKYEKEEAQTHTCTDDRGKWYTKTGGAKFEGYADFDLGQNIVDPVQHDLMTKGTSSSKTRIPEDEVGIVQSKSQGGVLEF